MKKVVLSLVIICVAFACKKPEDTPYCFVCNTIDYADTSKIYYPDTLCNTKVDVIKKLIADSTEKGLSTGCYRL